MNRIETGLAVMIGGFATVFLVAGCGGSGASTPIGGTPIPAISVNANDIYYSVPGTSVGAVTSGGLYDYAAGSTPTLVVGYENNPEIGAPITVVPSGSVGKSNFYWSNSSRLFLGSVTPGAGISSATSQTLQTQTVTKVLPTTSGYFYSVPSTTGSGVIVHFRDMNNSNDVTVTATPVLYWDFGSSSKSFVYASSGTGSTDIYEASFTGSPVTGTKLASIAPTIQVASLAVSPDGSKIAYGSSAFGIGSISIFDVPSSSTTTLLSSTGAIFTQLKYGNDVNHLVYESDSPTGTNTLHLVTTASASVDLTIATVPTGTNGIYVANATGTSF